MNDILIKTTQKRHKRIGKGHGSGRGGHTSTRGNKGQKAREDIGLLFEGTKFKKSLIKRLPLYRGKRKFKPFGKAPLVVNLKYLNLFNDGDVVDLEALQQKGIIDKKFPKSTEVKILGDGGVIKPLIIKLPCSKRAAEKIQASGGKIQNMKNTSSIKEKSSGEKEK